MNILIYSIPLFASFIGWSISSGIIYLLFRPIVPRKFLMFKFQGILPQNQEFITKSLAGFISKEMFTINELSSIIISPSSIEKVLPFIDEKVDYFLRVKLAEKMPMISMFIGEATMVELKSVFMDELQILFPELMNEYTNGILADIPLGSLIEKKILKINSSYLELIFKQTFTKKINTFTLISTAFGFTIGILQLIIVLLFH